MSEAIELFKFRKSTNKTLTSSGSSTEGSEGRLLHRHQRALAMLLLKRDARISVFARGFDVCQVRRPWGNPLLGELISCSWSGGRRGDSRGRVFQIRRPGNENAGKEPGPDEEKDPNWTPGSL